MNKLFGEIGIYAPRELVLNTAASGLGEIETFLRERLSCTINENQESRFYGAKEKRFLALPAGRFHRNSMTRAIRL